MQGYEHVRARHTYDQRAAHILETVFGGTGPRLQAPLRQRDSGAVDVAYAELYALKGWVDDTIEQYARVPRRYRLNVARQLALCVARRARYLSRL